MLSYKQWRMLNESVFPSFTLGVTSPNNLGVVGGNGVGLEEAKGKKMGKKMHGDEGEDGELVDAIAPKDDPDVDVDDEEHDGGCRFCGKNQKKSAKKQAKHMKKSAKKMWSDEDDAGGDFEEEDEDVESAEEETGKDLDGDNEEGEPEDHAEKVAQPLFQKKQGKKQAKKQTKKMKKESTDMSDEEQDWWNSVHSMIGAPQTKFSDGWSEYHEDALIPPSDPNAQVAKSEEPGPGEIGFAPQQRVGG